MSEYRAGRGWQALLRRRQPQTTPRCQSKLAARHSWLRRATSTRRPVGWSRRANLSSRRSTAARSARGWGLAVVADFRVTCKEARFAANFTAIGFLPGFGLTITLPRLIGQQRARWMFFTGKRIPGDEAFAMGLADRLVAQEDVRAVAHERRPRSRKRVLSGASDARRAECRLHRRLWAATERESFEQNWLRETNDYKEGVKARLRSSRPDIHGDLKMSEVATKMEEAKLLIGGEWQDGVEQRRTGQVPPYAVCAHAHCVPGASSHRGRCGPRRVCEVDADRVRPWRDPGPGGRARRGAAATARRVIRTEAGFTISDAKRPIRCIQTFRVSADEARRLTGEIIPLEGAPQQVGRIRASRIPFHSG